MSSVTFVWALVIGACATMALPHLLIGLRRGAWVNLLFAVAALAVADIAGGELAIMHSRTTEEIGRAQQWTHLPVFFLVVAIAGFVRLYFGTGRVWLGTAACGARLVALVINFACPPNLNFRAITGLRRFNFLGETIAMPEGVASAWTRLGELSSLLLLAFVIDASITLWRRGTPENRRRSVVVGGSITVFIVLAAGWSALVQTNVILAPYLISFPFLGVIAAMCFELSYDILRGAQAAQQLSRSETALRESEARMSLAAEAANLFPWTWDIVRDEVWVTEKGRELFGFTKTEPLNFSRFLKALHSEDRQRIEQLVGFVGDGDGEYEGEYRVVGPNGEIRWISGRGRVEFDRAGNPVFLRGVSREITVRKHAEDALRESEARFRIVADVAPVMIWMSGPNKEGIFFNKGWLGFTGRTVDQELGAGWLEGVHAEDIAGCLDVCGTAFAKREPFTVEYRLRRKDGEYRWLLDTGTPRFESDGTFLGYIGSCIDITERRQTEFDHQLQSTELARVGRVTLMGELAASLAHEINNPLGAMVTNASVGQRLMAQGKMDSDEFRELLADIVADGHRAREVIEGIRNMVRRTETSYSVIQPHGIIQDLLRIVRADALARKVTLVTELDENVGPVTGDRVQLLQVMLALTMNAFEALSVVRAELRRVVIGVGRAADGTICLTVADSGPGFPNSIAEQLFESFFSTKPEGTGMGLAIARSIVEAHGGTITGENCEAGGARFLVCLPEASENKLAAT